MFVLPTKGRPERMRQFLDAARFKGMTAPAIALIDPEGAEGYERIQWPANWRHVVRPVGLSGSGALNWFFKEHPGHSWYGTLSDDLNPLSEDWDYELEVALRTKPMVSANDCWQSNADPDRSRLSPVTLWRGDLLRAMGWWMLPGLWHYCCDDAWERLGRATGIWQTRMDIEVEHVHFMNGKAPVDPTYVHVYGPEAEATRVRDVGAFHQWINGQGYRDALNAIVRLYGMPVYDGEVQQVA